MRSTTILGSLVAACLVLATGCAHLSSVPVSPEREAEVRAGYARFLATYVRPDGVDYAAARGHAGDLDAYLAVLAGPLPRFAGADDRKGFFLDAYNACVLGIVLAHPEMKSIKDLPDPFGVPRCRVGGRLRSLDDIERTELRSLKDPRIHFALVCASRGCPRLEAAPFRDPALDARLDAATRRTFASPEYARADAASRTLWVTHLLAPDWLGVDFGPDEKTVMAWVRRYAREEIVQAIDAGYRVAYLDYDWSLNATTQPSISFVSPEAAARLLALDAAVLDVREGGFADGHLPRAASVREAELVDASYKHLPEAELARRFAQLGVDDARPVLVYGAAAHASGEEGHVAWLLVLLGHPCVRILDGGIDAWRAAGRPIEAGPSRPAATARFRPRVRPEAGVAIDEVARREGVLLDVRAADEVAAGRLPGARHLEWKQLLTGDGRLRSRGEVAALLQRAGVSAQQPIITYCTAGVRSAFAWAALRALGYPARNFEGSYAEWTRDPRRPIER